MKTSSTWVRRISAAGFLNLPTGSLGSAGDPNGILPTVANRLANILIAVALPLAVIGILYSAFQLLTKSGDADAFKHAKQNVGYIATGIVVIALAYALVNLVRLLLNT